MTPVFISSDQEEYKLGNKAGQALLLHLPSLFTDIKNRDKCTLKISLNAILNIRI